MGFSREILFDHHFDFITTEFTMREVVKYLPLIAKKAQVSENVVRSLFILLPLKVFPKEKYISQINKARELIVDEKDVDILALALETKYPLWSNDSHFEGIYGISLLKTKDFV